MILSFTRKDLLLEELALSLFSLWFKREEAILNSRQAIL